MYVVFCKSTYPLVPSTGQTLRITFSLAEAAQQKLWDKVLPVQSTSEPSQISVS